MKTIERAGMIGGLLRAKQRYDKAREPTKSHIAYEIVTWRKSLNMRTVATESALERVTAHPLDLSQTLTAQEYTAQVKNWFPSSYVDLEGLTPDNAKGVAMTLQACIKRYPKIGEGETALDAISSFDRYKSFLKTNKKAFDGLIDNMVESENIVDEFPQSLKEDYDSYFNEIRNSPWYSNGLFGSGASKVASACGVARDKKVRDAMSNASIRNEYGRIDMEAFFEVCFEAAKRKWAIETASKKFKSKNTSLYELSRFKVPKSASNANAFYQFCGSKKAVALCSPFYGDMTKIQQYAYEKGWHAPVPIDTPTKGAEYTTWHELGHALDYMLGIHDSEEFRKLTRGMKKIDIAEHVSRYAQTNDRELIAEAFTEYKLSESPRPFAMAIGRMIDEAYDQKFGAPQ